HRPPLDEGPADLVEMGRGQIEAVASDDEGGIGVGGSHTRLHGVGLGTGVRRLAVHDLGPGRRSQVAGPVRRPVVDDDDLTGVRAALAGFDHLGDRRRLVPRRHDDVDDHGSYEADRLRPARSPRATTLTATWREASSIISSPNMTAPLRSPSVACLYASRMSQARSNCSWVGEKTSFRMVTWSGWRAHLPSYPRIWVR